ncbi:hypothetical protein ACVWZW_004723 [Bradyrhizobium sp. F1.13.4]
MTRNSGVSSSVRRRKKISGTIKQPRKNGIRQPPGGNHFGRKCFAQKISDKSRDKDRNLLARGLKRCVKTAVARSGNLGEVDGNAANLNAGRKSLQQPSEQHDHGCGNADRRVAGTKGDDDGANGHDRKRDHQALPTANLVNIGSKHDRANRSHQGTQPEHTESVEQ